jgi:hypothetical protein
MIYPRSIRRYFRLKLIDCPQKVTISTCLAAEGLLRSSTRPSLQGGLMIPAGQIFVNFGEQAAHLILVEEETFLSQCAEDVEEERQVCQFLCRSLGPHICGWYKSHVREPKVSTFNQSYGCW